MNETQTGETTMKTATRKDEYTRRNELVSALTAFNTWEEFDIAMDYHGYVPTIHLRTEKHYRLMKMVLEAGYKVFVLPKNGGKAYTAHPSN